MFVVLFRYRQCRFILIHVANIGDEDKTVAMVPVGNNLNRLRRFRGVAMAVLKFGFRFRCLIFWILGLL